MKCSMMQHEMGENIRSCTAECYKKLYPFCAQHALWYWFNLKRQAAKHRIFRRTRENQTQMHVSEL